jgi:hypothetical protein
MSDYRPRWAVKEPTPLPTQTSGPYVPPSDPSVTALEKLQANKPLTAEEKAVVAKMPASQLPGGGAKNDEYKAPYWESTSAAEPVSVRSLPMDKRPKNFTSVDEMLVPRTPANVVKTASMAGAPTPPVAPNAIPIPTVQTAPIMDNAKTAPPARTAPPVSDTMVSGALVGGALASGGPAGAMKADAVLSQPVTREQATKAVDAMAQFLSANPDGATLANILDAVGVSLSAYGGTQRETMLQQRKKAELQVAQQKALKQAEAEATAQQAEVNFQRQMAMLAENARIAEIAAVNARTAEERAAALASKKQLDNQMALAIQQHDLALQRLPAEIAANRAIAGGQVNINQVVEDMFK